MLPAVLLATSLLQPALRLPFRPVGRGCRMVSDEPSERAARERMLAAMGEEPTWRRRSERPSKGTTEGDIIARQNEREAARKRMLALMGGSNEKLRRGGGVAFGFGAEDDEDYGYGPRPSQQWRLDEYDADQIDPMDGDPFDDRPRGKARKVEVTPAGPPPMEGTLRAPGQAQARQEGGGAS